MTDSEKLVNKGAGTNGMGHPWSSGEHHCWQVVRCQEDGHISKSSTTSIEGQRQGIKRGEVIPDPPPPGVGVDSSILGGKYGAKCHKFLRGVSMNKCPKTVLSGDFQVISDESTKTQQKNL